MKDLVRALCSKECAGRAPGTPGGLRARGLVIDALRAAGIDPYEQPIGRSKGANVVATLPGDRDRWVLVGAHYDHLGGRGDRFYPGADDNAAAVAILVEVARALAAGRASGRGVIFAAFDAEEPPYFQTGEMGSAYFAAHAPVPLDAIDTMVCMDLVGHTLGPSGVPSEVGDSVFVLGTERSAGTSAIVDELARAEQGIIARRIDAEVIPPLSDYDAFWRRGVPFAFLTCGRSARYHTTDDTPEHLAWEKMEATARWLERFVRASCARPEDRVTFLRDARDDRATLESFLGVVSPLAGLTPVAAEAMATAKELLGHCDTRGRLPAEIADMPSGLVAALEGSLA
ncbi:MAG: M28 family peptidase [Deltaproteobacteria bacterium]|nr:M28 family peptidase [Deltaproteobacteria bacterium]